MFYSVVSIIGLALMGWVANPWVRYFGVFVAVSGVQSSISAVISYQVCCVCLISWEGLMSYSPQTSVVNGDELSPRLPSLAWVGLEVQHLARHPTYEPLGHNYLANVDGSRLSPDRYAQERHRLRIRLRQNASATEPTNLTVQISQHCLKKESTYKASHEHLPKAAKQEHEHHKT